MYFRFLYIIFTYDNFYSNNSNLDNIEKEFNTILSKHPDHFKKSDYDDNFYIFAKNYIDNNYDNNLHIFSKDHQYNNFERKLSKKNIYEILDDNLDYYTIVNLTFDALFLENELIYNYFKDKLLNSWYQKTYREKNKGKKHYYFLTKQAKNNLDILTQTLNLTEEKVIEYLINEYYKKHCLDENEKSLY